MTNITAVEFEVWWVPQVPMTSFRVQVPDLDTGLLMLDTLAKYDLFQYHHKVKPDYSNAGGLRYRFRNASNPKNDGTTEDDWEEVDEDDEDDVAQHRQRITAAMEGDEGTTEYIDSNGHLRVPVREAIDVTPVREGWTPYWVNTNLHSDPQKIVLYRRKES